MRVKKVFVNDGKTRQMKEKRKEKRGKRKGKREKGNGGTVRTITSSQIKSSNLLCPYFYSR
jgi:hypothetical protein